MSKALEAVIKIENFIHKNIENATLDDCKELGDALGIIKVLINRYETIKAIIE